MDAPRFGRCPSSSSSISSTITSTTVPHHRRAHSETLLRLPDDDILLFDSPDFPSLADLDFPSLSDDVTPSAPPLAGGDTERKRGGAHLRSLSVDNAFFESLAFQHDAVARPRHSGSVDEAESWGSVDFPKKAMAAEKLAELSLIDPKRAKRILANRQSAARSKERKVRYTGELEKKVHTLQTEATTLSAQVTLLQKDTAGLTVENKELKLRLEAMEQQAHLRDALNGALREEVQRLKIATGQIQPVNGNSYDIGFQQQPFPYFGQLQQLRGFATKEPTQLHVPQVPSNGHQAHRLHGIQSVDSMDFM